MNKRLIITILLVAGMVWLGSCAASGPAQTAEPANVQGPEATPTTGPVNTQIPAATSTPKPTETPAVNPTDPLMSIHAEGGLCVYGGCSRDTVILQNGTIIVNDGSGTATTQTLSAEALAQLKQAIDTADFAAIQSKQFTGTCPIAYDGQEYTFTFYQAGVKYVLDSCKVALDMSSPMFKTDY